VQPIEPCPAVVDHLGSIEQSEPAPRLASEEDILRRRELGKQIEFLVDHADSVPARHQGRRDFGPPSIQEYVSAIGRHGSGEYFHQCRLAGAILPYQGVTLARTNLERSLIESFNSREGLRYPAHYQVGLAHKESFSPPGREGAKNPEDTNTGIDIFSPAAYVSSVTST
jgi:hypothetical protein